MSRKERVLERFRRLPEGVQGLLVAGTLGLIAFAALLAIQLA
jgi:hypothetical protein